jgi:diguanylate cyclase (GGDEF)-like protein/PAS domain S-box-containing protein
VSMVILIYVSVLLLGCLLGGGAVYYARKHIVGRRQFLKKIKKLNIDLRKTRAENAIMELIVNNANDGLLIQDIDGHIEWSNPAYSRMTGYSADEIRGLKPQEFVLPKEARQTQQEIDEFRYDISSGVLEYFECIQNRRKNGELFWNQLSFAVAKFNEEDDPKVIIIAREVTEQREHEDELKRSEMRNKELAEFDSLTGLPNRMKLSRHLELVVDSAMANGITAGLLHIDLDQFKRINDTLGHAVGDQVLLHAANEMTRIVADSGMVGRFGGDEFLVVFEETLGFDPLKKIAAKILAALEKPFVTGDHVVQFGCSIGIAISGDHAKNATDLIKHADVALYEVKRSGRHNFSCFNKVLGMVYARRMELSSQLAFAITDNQLAVELQPQYDLELGQVHGFEALIRWHHPTYGKLLPQEFLTIAEQNGLMSRVDHVAMCGALDALRQMHDAGHSNLRVSINVSNASLNKPTFITELCDAVKCRGLANDHVTLEVLETNLLEGMDSSNLETIRAACNEGFRVELDDFGMGYAGLAHLTRIATHGVKIDRSMVRNMLLDPATLTIVRTIIALCSELGMSVVAEGIEEIEQAEELQAAGCAVIQGFGVGHPMPLSQALKWLQRSEVSPIISNISPTYRQFDELREFLLSK